MRQDRKIFLINFFENNKEIALSIFKQEDIDFFMNKSNDIKAKQVKNKEKIGVSEDNNIQKKEDKKPSNDDAKNNYNKLNKQNI